MPVPRVRPPAVILAIVLALTAVTPALATDPPSDEPAQGPSVHYEMLIEHGDEAPAFEPGGTPAPLTSPSGDGGTMTLDGGTGGIAALPNGLSHEVFGYLPSWMLSSSSLQHLRYDLVSTIAYFGVEARKDGTLATSTSGAVGWGSSTMTDVISKAHQRGIRVVLTVTMMAWNYDFTDMEALLTSPSRRAALIGAIASSVKSRNADGVNVDFEPVPPVPPHSADLRDEFTTFIHELKAGLKAHGAGSYVTVATMAGAASWTTGYDLAGLTAPGGADALMVMAYDFHWAGSARAGGVAPYVSPYAFDAKTALEAHLKVVPGSKLIWGVPYYGRAWTTESGTVNARTCKTTSICPTAKSGSGAIGRTWAPGYIDALEATADHGRQWDSTGQVPWYRYQSSTYGTWVQGYYDDPASLKHKYGLVKANGLRGAGIWHLLLDGSRRDLWDLLYTQFGPLPFTDISDSQFVFDIVWLADRNLTGGCTVTTFCPKSGVTRGQMASFLSRYLKLPATSTDYFDDDDGTTHEGSINRVAAAGITRGCDVRRFCPDASVLREQMASFLARALKLPATSTDYFDDDDGTTHEGSINRLAASRIAGGCGDRRYCPRTVVTREQMAAFLHRASRY